MDIGIDYMKNIHILLVMNCCQYVTPFFTIDLLVITIWSKEQNESNTYKPMYGHLDSLCKKDSSHTMLHQCCN